LCLFFNKISDKGRTEPAGTEGGRRGEGKRGAQGAEIVRLFGNSDPHVHMLALEWREEIFCLP
jgi:hypothetical protein